jgi:hypothetical protein
MRLILGLALAALLAGCGGEPEGGVTAEESDQLNEAAEMLESEDTLIAGDETGLANGETANTGDVLVSDAE